MDCKLIFAYIRKDILRHSKFDHKNSGKICSNFNTFSTKHFYEKSLTFGLHKRAVTPSSAEVRPKPRLDHQTNFVLLFWSPGANKNNCQTRFFVEIGKKIFGGPTSG